VRGGDPDILVLPKQSFRRLRPLVLLLANCPYLERKEVFRGGLGKRGDETDLVTVDEETGHGNLGGG